MMNVFIILIGLWFHIVCRQTYVKIYQIRDFPGGTVVKNPPTNAGGHRFDPWAGKIPHAEEQLSPCATTTEPAL